MKVDVDRGQCEVRDCTLPISYVAMWTERGATENAYLCAIHARSSTARIVPVEPAPTSKEETSP